MVFTFEYLKKILKFAQCISTTFIIQKLLKIYMKLNNNNNSQVLNSFGSFDFGNNSPHCS